MAHFVGKTLHIRPNEILDEWGVPELIVAYGEYANEMADKAYHEWLSVKKSGGKVGESPPRSIVTFISAEEFEDG